MFVLERVWNRDDTVLDRTEHNVIDDACDHVRRVDVDDPDERLRWNLVEVIDRNNELQVCLAEAN